MGMSKQGPQDLSIGTPQSAEPESSISVDGCKTPVQAWKQLISCPLPATKCIPLIQAIFQRNEVGEVNHLSGDDAQTFVNVIDEVGTLSLLLSWG